MGSTQENDVLDHAASAIRKCRRPVSEYMRQVVGEQTSGDIRRIIRYHLGWADADGSPADTLGGKHIRPTLCVVTCAAVGGRATEAVEAAAALEFLHGFTLVHDDIMDEDTLRRGRASVWALWGPATALLVGDALHALANVALAQVQAFHLSPSIVCAVSQELNRAAVAVCEGQYQDSRLEGRNDVTVAEYLAMAERKTAALFASACSIGARIADAPSELAEAVRRFGHHLGLAFQIRDDVLGIWGTPEQLGKPVGSDLRRKKRSLPVVHAVIHGTARLRRELSRQDRTTAVADEDTTSLAAQMERTGSREFCHRLAREFSDRALSELDGLDVAAGPAQELRSLAVYAAMRAT